MLSTHSYIYVLSFGDFYKVGKTSRSLYNAFKSIKGEFKVRVAVHVDPSCMDKAMEDIMKNLGESCEIAQGTTYFYGDVRYITKVVLDRCISVK